MIDKKKGTKLQIVQHELSTKSLSQYITQNRALSFPIGSEECIPLNSIQFYEKIKIAKITSVRQLGNMCCVVLDNTSGRIQIVMVHTMN